MFHRTYFLFLKCLKKTTATVITNALSRYMTEAMLTLSSVWISRSSVFILLKTVVTDVASSPDLFKMLYADLMLTTTTADTAHEPEPTEHVNIITIVNSAHTLPVARWC